jgi:hypothetical protein
MVMHFSLTQQERPYRDHRQIHIACVRTSNLVQRGPCRLSEGVRTATMAGLSSPPCTVLANVESA